jgi:holo-[acyl-carrier protein] synthase
MTVGLHVVELARFERALARTPGLRDRLFTTAERDLPIRSLAARFAAKAALAKALGGPRGLCWTDAEIPGTGRPALRVAGVTVPGIHLSLTHEAGLAVALVLSR